MVATIQVLEIRKISLQGVLLLCYAQWCGFCASLVHIYIPLAWLLHPGNFTVARKEQSMKFPEDFSINLPNLILHHSSFSSSEPCTKECPHKETVLQQGRISHLEREIQKLRSEIGALHQAYDTAAQLSEARREQQKLQQQKHALEKQHNTLQLPSEQLQATHDRKNRELLEMAEKLQEVADASENLLKENTFLRFLVASREEKLQSKDEIKEFLQSEQTLSEDNAVSVSKATAAFEEKRIDNINTTETEHSSGNRTE
ncbi:thioredoxin domain-containing protein 11-like isoform X1 [Patagioenas fasciata]|uniref:thioredoxin domain-containing protein 11-like isoform X1 n=1 Tax=Patagioenas fasciata TaxID=372321 RepID=UPI003A99A9F6